MTPRPSLRRRVAFGFAFFTMVITVIMVLTVLDFSEDLSERLLDAVLSEEMDYFADQYRINPRYTPNRTQNFYGYVARDREERQHIPEVLRNMQPGVHEVYLKESELHVVVRDVNGARLYLTYDVTRHERHMYDFREHIFVALGAVALLALALGYWLAGQAVRPVTQLARQVDELAGEQGHAALAAQYKHDEVVRLAAAFDNYVERLRQMMEREKNFTGDVSHELRTPLTALKTSCELLLADSAVSGANHERISRMAANVERMTELVRGLLFLAREGQAGDAESLEPQSFLKHALEALDDQYPGRIRIDVVAEAGLRASRQALAVVVTNLVKNALEHTSGDEVIVRYDEGALQISDRGRGLTEAELARVFDRFARGEGSTGFGLGLAIVKRICEVQGWELKIESEAGAGTTATLGI